MQGDYTGVQLHALFASDTALRVPSHLVRKVQASLSTGYVAQALHHALVFWRPNEEGVVLFVNGTAATSSGASAVLDMFLLR